MTQPRFSESDVLDVAERIAEIPDDREFFLFFQLLGLSATVCDFYDYVQARSIQDVTYSAPHLKGDITRALKAIAAGTLDSLFRREDYWQTDLSLEDFLLIQGVVVKRHSIKLAAFVGEMKVADSERREELKRHLIRLYLETYVAEHSDKIRDYYNGLAEITAMWFGEEEAEG